MVTLMKLSLALALIPQTQLPSEIANVQVIETTATGEVTVPADIATVSIGAQFRDSRAKAAAEQLAAATASIVEALVYLGFSADSIPTTGFDVSPEYDYRQEGRPLIGYNASGSVEVRLRDLSRIGEVIDAVLAAGADDISSISYSTTRLEEVRAEALRMAVDRARNDAGVLAQAAGGQIGELLEISTAPRTGAGGPVYPEAVVVSRAATQGAPTHVTPRQVRVAVSIVARWRFVP
jgi:uncharacterized protein YggE